MKVKINREGQPCRKCSTPVIKKLGSIKKKSALKYNHYYEWFFVCLKCHTFYLVPEARREITEEQREQVLGTDLFLERIIQANSLFDNH